MIDRSEASRLLARTLANLNVGKVDAAGDDARALIDMLRNAGVPVDVTR